MNDCHAGCRVPQVSLILRDLGVATSAMSIAFFLRHFGSRVVDMALAQVSQQQRDLGHPASPQCPLPFRPAK